MNINLWKIITEINHHLNPLRERDASTTLTTTDLVELRSKVRTQLEDLRSAIIQQHSERDAYFVLFPLTAHCDEVVKKIILDSNNLEWPPLQQELYQVVDAGDLFYELLDKALKKSDTLPLVYEVFYFCLNDGFCGRYNISPKQLMDYAEKLRDHIHLQTVEPRALPAPVAKKWSGFRRLHHFYYVGVALLLIVSYFFLTDLANSWQPAI